MIESKAVSVRSLASVWRSDAMLLRRRGAELQAGTLESAATDLEQALAQGDDELLGLAAAAKQSGFSVDHLGRLLRSGAIPNAGRKHAPRIRRADLPIRPGHLREQPPTGNIAEVRADLARGVATRN